MMEEARVRNSNMDLLRIVSMLLIILLHSLDEHGGILQATDAAGDLLSIYTRSIYMMTMVSVNCFVMMTGYFQIKSRFRLHKLVALWLEVVFYSLVIRVIFILLGYRPFSIKSVLSCFLPVFSGRYWFITIYFGLYLLSPFLNITIRAMDKKMHTVLNILLIVLFSLWISVHPFIAGMNTGRGWSLSWFIVLYFFAAWLRLYYKKTGKIRLKTAAFLTLSILVALIYCLTYDNLHLRMVTDNWYSYDSVPAVLLTFLFFTIFMDIHIKGTITRILPTISKSTLGVYLIHAHADCSAWIWETADLPGKVKSPIFPLLPLGIILAIFIVCTVIDIIRRATFGRIEKAEITVRLCERLSCGLKGYLKKWSNR